MPTNFDYHELEAISRDQLIDRFNQMGDKIGSEHVLAEVHRRDAADREQSIRDMTAQMWWITGIIAASALVQAAHTPGRI